MVWLIIAIAILCIGAFFFILKNKQNKLEEHFQKRFSNRAIQNLDKSALYVARESDGLSHFRGIGYLVLTEKELFFERQLKSIIIHIPISSIISIGKTKRLGGQSPGPLMLKVIFKDQSGETDAIAWKVRELDGWIAKLTELVNHGKS